MATRLFEGHRAISRGDDMAFPRFRRAKDSRRTIGVIKDIRVPEPADPVEALSAAMALRPLATPQPQPPALSLISASSQSLGISCSSSQSLGRLQPWVPKSPKQIATERAARFGCRLSTFSAPVQPNLDNYAQTGLRMYRPPRVARNSMGWIDVGDVGNPSLDAILDPSSMIHLHVHFSHSGTPRPAGARGRSFSGRGGDQLGGRHTRPKPSVAVAASTETAASTHEAILSSPVGREMMRSVAVAPQSSERSLDGQSSGASLLPTSSAAALVPTRREISLRRIRNRAVRRSDLAIPRFLPPAHFVSDATVRRLVRRCREDVADQKRWEDQAEQARIDAEVKRIESEEKAQLAAEMKAAWECEQQEIRDEVTRQAAVARQQHERTLAEAAEREKEFERMREENERASRDATKKAERIRCDIQAAIAAKEERVLAQQDREEAKQRLGPFDHPKSLDDREELEAAEPKHAALASGTSRFPDAHHIEVRKSATLPPRSRNRLLSLLLKP